MLLNSTDDLLERYFGDSKVGDAVGQDVRKFLRSQDQLEKHESILLRYADTVSSSPKNRRLIEALDAALR